MINTSIHLDRQKPRFGFSEERENRFGERYRYLAIEVTGIGYVDIYLTTEQAKELADTICERLLAEKKKVVTV